MKAPESDCREGDTELSPEISSDTPAVAATAAAASTAAEALSKEYSGLAIRASEGIL